MKVVAQAHPNIALAKYWGKMDRQRNLPAVPSVSLTLAGMTTRTEIELGAAEDALFLDGEAVAGRPLERVTAALDLVWQQPAQRRPPVVVRSANDFPTAAGLASSASAFAALCVAANAAFERGLNAAELSDMARQISASAGRSLLGGFVELPLPDADCKVLPARQLATEAHWDLRLVVAVTTDEKKDVGSTEGMLRTAATSPLYAAWLESAPAICGRVRSAVLARDFSGLGPAMEQSALAMHATALGADPGLVYWNGTTVEVIKAVRRLRGQGLESFFTIDAGPHVKVLVEPDNCDELCRSLESVEGVLRTIVTQPGPAATVVSG
jgi:diphosphomevalonate decarboxylase